MRYIVIPPKQVLDAVINKQTKQPISYGLHDFLQEYCWGQPGWRDGGEASMKACDRIFVAFNNKQNEGDVVALTDEDYEVFKPIATLKGKPIPPAFAIQFNRLMLPIVSASTEPPKSLGEANAGGNGQNKPEPAGNANANEA